jgi:hypothetical protein
MLNQLENMNAVAVNDPTTTPPARADGAQAMLDRVAAWELEIPDFSFPVPVGDRRPFTVERHVPPDFVEQMAVAMKGVDLLSRGGSDPEQLRDLAQYATSYGPVATAIERLGAKMRNSVDSARAKAGAEALLTFKVAERLSKLPGTTHLAPMVETMRRTLRTASVFRRAKKAKKDGAETPAPTTPTTPVTPEPHTL